MSFVGLFYRALCWVSISSIGPFHFILKSPIEELNVCEKNHKICEKNKMLTSCCSELQRVAACCSVLQRVTACCSVLHVLMGIFCRALS